MSGAKNGKSEISAPQVAGGALASVTAAYLGSYLGVAGTFWGAGLTSVVITVGGTVYQRSLERTREKANVAAAKAALVRARKQWSPGEEATRRIRPVGQSPGRHWPGGEPVVDDPAPTRVVRPRRRRWVTAGVSGVLMFVLCLLVVTSWEGVTGRPLSGGGGTTSLGRVLDPGHDPAGPVPVPSTSDSTVPPVTTEDPSATVGPNTSEAPSTSESPPSSARVPETGGEPQPSRQPVAPEPTREAPTGTSERAPAREPTSAPLETGGLRPQGDDNP